MNMHKLLTGFVCLALASVGHAKPGKLDKAVTANNTFGFELYQQIKRNENKPNQNRLVSPVSAYFAVSMASNGARGETETAIRKTIAASNLTRAQLNDANLDLLKELNSRKEVTMSVANSVWTRQGLGLLETFADAARRYYQADARELDFTDPSAAKIINGWVSEKTHEKIKEIVKDPIQDDFYLVNATYFKGQWTHPFAEELTKPKAFKTANGVKEVPTLHGELMTRYVKGSDFEVVEMPYGAMGEASMLLFTTDNLDRLEEMTVEKWNQINQALEQSKTYMVELSLPKFEFEDEADLVQPLTNLGMGIAFGGGADFRDLTRNNMALSQAFQKTYIRLDEKGTEAAAVTVIAGATSVPMYEQVTVKADKPFLVAIRDNQTQALLFLGAVVNP